MGAIILPGIIVAVVGLIAGIILTVASKLMFVPVDEKVGAIREILPGANCGACGFAGCDDYAAAFGEDPETSPTLCPVGGAEVATKIAGVLGVEAGEVEEEVAMVMCKGNANVTRRIMDADRLYTCRSTKQFYGGQWACTYGCLGLGDCKVACEYDAIDVVNGVALVNRDKCVGCKACSKVCPNNIIEMVKKKSLVFVACKSRNKGAATRKDCSTGCIGCMKCQKTCKFDAIVVEDNLARIIEDACKNCGMCAKECPTGAIVNLRRKKTPAKPAAPKTADSAVADDAPKAETAPAPAEAPAEATTEA